MVLIAAHKQTYLMGLVMVFQMLAALLVIAAIVAIIVAAITLAIAAMFFTAAKTSPKGKRKIALYIVSALFASPAAILAEGALVGPAIMPFMEQPIILALFTAGILALFIIGLKMRRVRFALKMLICIPQIFFGAWFLHCTIVAFQMAAETFFEWSFILTWVIVTGISAFLFIRSAKRIKLVIASNNKGKVREFKRLLSSFDYEVISQSKAGIKIEVDETGATFEENARLKAKAVHDLCKLPVIADDSGLEVDYLGGEPGVYSARYAPVGQRRATILAKLDGVPKEQRTARFVCCICYIDKEREINVRGECEGYIGFENRGKNGFGYDSIFMYGDKSFAEMTDKEKNEVSHRGAALRELQSRLYNYKADKIGIFGGAFDPPHTGHVNLAVGVADKLNLDKVIVIPTGVSPHKEASATPYADRLAMAKLAFECHKNFEVSDIENKADKSYTVDTLRELKRRYIKSELYLIIGGDMLTSFDKWRDYEEILKLCKVVAAAREDNYAELQEYAGKFGITLLELPIITASSSGIRDCFKEDLLPEAVYNYAKERGLYH